MTDLNAEAVSLTSSIGSDTVMRSIDSGMKSIGSDTVMRSIDSDIKAIDSSAVMRYIDSDIKSIGNDAVMRLSATFLLQPIDVTNLSTASLIIDTTEHLALVHTTFTPSSDTPAFIAGDIPIFGTGTALNICSINQLAYKYVVDDTQAIVTYYADTADSTFSSNLVVPHGEEAATPLSPNSTDIQLSSASPTCYISNTAKDDVLDMFFDCDAMEDLLYD